MEHRIPYAFEHAEFPVKHREHTDSARDLRCRRNGNDKLGKLYDAAQARAADRLLQGAALHEAEAPAPRHKTKHDGNRHNPHAADLNEDQYNDLPEEGPVCARILRNKPRYANGGGCGKQRVKIGRPFAAAG